MKRSSPNECKRPPISRSLLHLFGRYSDIYLRRHFHRVRLLKSGSPVSADGLPLVIYLNHASWWDPLVCLLLARRFFPERESYGPIDAHALGRYRFFERLGFFAVEKGVAGAANFLRATESILSSEKSALWITPQGRFSDVRERPVLLRAGLSHIASRAEGAAFIPLAIEYSFWEERLPEILISFGRPVGTETFEVALASVQDRLSAAAQRRDPGEWTLLLNGAEGTGGIYEIWNRSRAKLLGKSYAPAHSPL